MPNKFAPKDKPYQSLFEAANQRRTQTHLELGELSTKISREVIAGTTFDLKDEISDLTLSYEIVKQLGVGSFGVVYKGFNIQDPEKKEVAIKIEPYDTLYPCIQPLKDIGKKALEIETRSIEGLVSIYAAGRVERIVFSNPPRVRRKVVLSRDVLTGLNRFLQRGPASADGEIFLGCLVMEYINGRSLSSILGASRDQSESEESQLLVNRLRLLQIMIDTSIAIERLHRVGFVHCDLHPRNILATDSGVKIIDFTCVKHIGDHSGRISGSIYTPVSYASEADQIRSDKGIANYVDVYPLAMALYDALADQPVLQRTIKPLYDDSGRLIGHIPAWEKNFSRLDQIHPAGLSDVIRKTLQIEHPELSARQGQNPAIQRARDLASELIRIFKHEYSNWLEQTEKEIQARQNAEGELSALENQLAIEQKIDKDRWEDFSVWWANEMEKEHDRREHWADDQLQWIQREYYQEALRRESEKTRSAMFDVLANEIVISIDMGIDKTKRSESKRVEDLFKTRKTLDGYRATHRKAVEVKLKSIKVAESERWRQWSANPIRVIGETFIYIYGTIALATERVFRPFTIFVRETTGEFRRITWPTRQEAWQETSIVLGAIAFWGTISALIDATMNFVLSVLLKH